MRIMVIGAHPDDPDFHCGASAALWARRGARVVFVSLTNGDKGHQTMDSASLAARRKAETQAAAQIYGIEKYVVLDHRDCELESTLETRRELTRIVREFAPHVILTHRTCDYHADHRTTGQIVMDATYLLGVPLWCPDCPVPDAKPVVYYMRDGFERPWPQTHDLAVALDDDSISLQIRALACHESQVFEWLPYDMGVLDEVPDRNDLPAVAAYISKYWIEPRSGADARRHGLECAHADVFCLSEYGRTPTAEEISFLSESKPFN
jgi:LmbE family N-acetylglucosaminyl deacetylase